MCLLKHHTPDSRVRVSIASLLNPKPGGGLPRPLRPGVAANNKFPSRCMIVSDGYSCIRYILRDIEPPAAHGSAVVTLARF